MFEKEREMSKNQNPLGIRMGDSVRIFFDFKASGGEFTAKVMKVVDRTDMGNDSYIEYIPEEAGRNMEAEKLGIPYGCSVSHIVKVLEKAPYITKKGERPVNIFREEQRRLSHGGWPGYYKLGGVRVCYTDMRALVRLVFAGASGTFDRPLDMDKFHVLWEKSKFLGKVEMPAKDGFNEDHWMTDHYTAVHWKVFKKFVLNNKERIFATRKEMVQAGVEFHKAMWEDDCLDDMDDDTRWDEDDEYSDEEEILDYAD